MITIQELIDLLKTKIDPDSLRVVSILEGMGACGSVTDITLVFTAKAQDPRGGIEHHTLLRATI